MGKRSGTRYFGKVCEKHPELGGLRRRSGHCVLCLRESAAKWRIENPEKHREKNSRYAKSPRGRAVHRKAAAKWDRANPEKRAAITRQWGEANPEKVRAKSALRRARKAGADVPLTKAERLCIEAIYAEARCKTRKTGEQHHVHHDKPLARGGKHHPDNLLVVPASINLAMGDRYESTWDFISS
jgi:hypothetical protein